MLDKLLGRKPAQPKLANELREYLYVDTARLDLYLQQIANPFVFDKVSEWNLELSITGPKASGKQARSSRGRTDHEKIVALEQYLEKKELLSHERHYLRSSDGKFYLEKVSASCSMIAKNEFELKVWIASDDISNDDDRRSKRHLILIQDFRGDCKYSHSYSSYSGLRLLLGELDWLKSTSLQSIPADIAREDEISGHLAFNPYALLKKLGANFAPPRPISALYRVRASCFAWDGPGPSGDRFAPTVIGYPIAIWE